MPLLNFLTEISTDFQSDLLTKDSSGHFNMANIGSSNIFQSQTIQTAAKASEKGAFQSKKKQKMLLKELSFL